VACTICRLQYLLRSAARGRRRFSDGFLWDFEALQMGTKSSSILRRCLAISGLLFQSKACCCERTRRLRFEALEDRQLLTAGGLAAALGGEGQGGGAGGDIRVFVPDDLVVARGGLNTVPIKFEITKPLGTGISSFNVVIEFEPKIFTVSGSQLGSLLEESDSTFELAMAEPADGILILSADSVQGSVPFDAGSVGDLFIVTFAVASDALTGPRPINVRAAYGLMSSAVFANDLSELILWPVPTDGSGDAIDGVVMIVDPPQIQMTIVRQPTQTDHDGVVASVPDNADWVHEWESFWVELWLSTSDATPAAVAAATVDLHYASDLVTAQEIIHGPAFPLDATGTIDDAEGRVGEIGGRTELNGAGQEGYVLLSRVRFASTGADRVPVDPAGRTIGPYDMRATLANGRTVLVGGGSSASQLGESPRTKLWAVVYDIDDNGWIDFGDLAFFAPAFGREVGQPDSEPPFTWWADFDKSGLVDYGDLSFFAAAFGKSRGGVQSGREAIVFPPNFPASWGAMGPSNAEGEGWVPFCQVIEASSTVDRAIAGCDRPKQSAVWQPAQRPTGYRTAHPATAALRGPRGHRSATDAQFAFNASIRSEILFSDRFERGVENCKNSILIW
jgi:hypothetical protein